MSSFKIGEKVIGKTQPLYFIADIGANHDGHLDKAYQLIELAKEAGADAAKFQNFQAAKIVSKFGFENLNSKVGHQSAWKKSVYEIYEDASISMNWTALLKEKCKEVGIDYFTSPYDIESVDHVDEFVDVYKIGSGDITWHEIIEHIAAKLKPVLIATGASTPEQIKSAVQIIEQYTDQICIMQCNTNYTLDTSKIKYVNLNVLKEFGLLYPNYTLGLSDHTLGHATVCGAVALGATIFEKHFTDSNDNEGPDHKFAMNPHTWKEMVNNAYDVFYALGDGIKKVEENEKDSLIVQQRSLRAVGNLPEGHIISKEDFEALRPIPANGLQPYLIDTIIGKKMSAPLKKGEHITYSHIK